MTTVAFIGHDKIGLLMISNLVRANYKVIAFDSSPWVRAQARAAGALAGENAEAAAEVADVVITLLPTGAQVQRAWTECLPALQKDALLIDCSTISIDCAKQAHQMAARYGKRTLDAPVFGCQSSAQQDELTFFCGGDQDTFSSAKTLLGAMGTAVYCGRPGAGQAAKICSSMLLAISMVAISEAFSLGEKLDLSHQVLFDVVKVLSRQPWFHYCPVPGIVPNSPANNNYRPGLAASAMLNDLHLSQDAAKRAGVFTPLGWHTENIYDEFEKAGYGGSDFSGIIQHLRALTRYIDV